MCHDGTPAKPAPRHATRRTTTKGATVLAIFNAGGGVHNVHKEGGENTPAFKSRTTPDVTGRDSFKFNQ